MKKSIGAGFVALALVGCGGGGGSSATPSVPVPAVSLTLSQPKTSIGSPVTVAWSSTNATSCTASGAWSGIQSISGSAIQTPTASGVGTYTLTCSGAGGSANQSVSLTVPIPVLKSSYENKAAAGESIGAQTLPSEVAAGNAVAFADFFQDGTYSMVTHTLEYNSQDPSTASKFGHIHFWQKVNGTWVDHTSTLLANNTGCLHPRKAVVADFNGDGKPDIFFACHGFDASPFSGEQPHVLLSQPDGTYKNVTIPVTCYCHSASAADIHGNGYADVLVTDQFVQKTPFFFTNNKDGTFNSDFSHFPKVINAYQSNGQQGITGSNTGLPEIFTSELIDFSGTGHFDAFLAGNAPDNSFGNWPPTIFKNDGSGVYSASNATVLPYSQQYQTTLDIVYQGGFVYLTAVQDTYSSNPYGFSNIVKINPATMASTQIYANTANFSNGRTWLNWIVPNNGHITSLDTTYGVSVSQ
ncbi:FG-GAP repeat domain-containing protein [Collimonas arenae]|uniref:FG-GAP repeat domain-containing protein n=1 Tax=Collimonas arenae TaxID=279058 RepID=UPI0009EEF239|nr:VCBS repeat-containing protein [Collimonas arenae]